MKKEGFTLVELLAVIVVLAIILAIAIPNISGIVKNSTMSSMQSDAKLILKAIDLKKLEDKSFDPLSYNGNTTGLLNALNLSNQNYGNIAFVEHEGILFISITGKNKWAGLTACGNYHDMNAKEGECDLDFVPPVLTLNGNSSITIEPGDTYNDLGATALDNKDGDLTSKINITGSVNPNVVGEYTITYTVSDNNGNTTTIKRTVMVIRPYNAPVLAQGMVPIKWNGTTLEDTTEDDPDWYKYTTTAKKWANARTADGSMWVWIPRYAYQIASGYHTSTAGTVNIKFLKDNTNNAYDGTTIETTPTYNVSSQTNYIHHPAFTFGTTELTGIWVSKFEISGPTSALDSKPGVASLEASIGNMFTASRNMETNSRYGWSLASGLKADGTFTADTNNVDSHMIKNIEWGSVAFLTQSTYGKNAEIIRNPVYSTGGGTDNAYITNVGQSTTGNVYGIYDMSGCKYEYVMGNFNNTVGSSGLTPANINNIYINRYTAYDNTTFGDAMYETSSSGGGNVSWYQDASGMINASNPWIGRDAYADVSNPVATGVFGFNAYVGQAANGWAAGRVIILVGPGL